MTPGAPILAKPSRKYGRLFLVKSRTESQRFVLEPAPRLIDQRDERAMRGSGREGFAGLYRTLA